MSRTVEYVARYGECSDGVDVDACENKRHADKLIKEAFKSHLPPRIGLKRLDIVRAYQTGINPPSFTFLVNDPKLVHFSYRRYLENRLRQTFGFTGTSLQLVFKKAPRRRGKSTKEYSKKA